MYTRKLVSLTLLWIVAGCCTLDSAEPTSTIDIESVVEQLKSALVTTQKDLQARAMPPLKSVKISLGVESKTTDSGEISFWVVAGKNSKSEVETQKVTFVLQPPSPDAAEAIGADSLHQTLVQAILAAAESSKSVRNAAGAGPVPLQLNSISISIGFSLTHASSGGLAFDVGGVTIGGNSADSATATHQIDITFE